MPAVLRLALPYPLLIDGTENQGGYITALPFFPSSRA